MGNLDAYLQRKTAAVAARHQDWTTKPEAGIVQLSASSRLAPNGGSRPTRMGNHLVVSDSAPGLAGDGLGPTAPELLMGALASCLLHTYVIHACLQGVPVDSMEVIITGQIDMKAATAMNGYSNPLIEGLQYEAKIEASSATADQIEALHAAVDANCPVLNTLRLPNTITRKLS
jgi:uncharacterized OsmC-like protein